MKKPPNINKPDLHPEGAGSASALQTRSREVTSLFRQHNQLLVRFLRVRLGSEQEAKEIAQEAYVKLLQIDLTGAVSFLRAYLFKVATNLAIDRIRERTKYTCNESLELFEELEDSVAPERTAIASQQLDLLAAALTELPEKCRDAFMLHRYHDRTQTEIAEAFGMSERMIRNYLVHAVLYCKLRLDGFSPDAAKAKLKQ